MTPRIAIPFLKYPDGWQGWCYVSTATEADKWKYFRRFDQIEAPTQQQIDDWLSKCAIRAQQDEDAIAPAQVEAELNAIKESVISEYRETVNKTVVSAVSIEAAKAQVVEVVAKEAIEAKPELAKDEAKKAMDLYQQINCGKCAVEMKLPYDCVRCEQVKNKEAQEALLRMGY